MTEASESDSTHGQLASINSTYERAKRAYGVSSRSKTDQQTLATAVTKWHEAKVRLKEQLNEQLEEQLEKTRSDAGRYLSKARSQLASTMVTSRGE